MTPSIQVVCPVVYPVLGQNGSGQNGTDKMVWTKWYGQNGIGQNGMDKMVRTKWYDQNITDKVINQSAPIDNMTFSSILHPI